MKHVYMILFSTELIFMGSSGVPHQLLKYMLVINLALSEGNHNFPKKLEFSKVPEISRTKSFISRSVTLFLLKKKKKEKNYLFNFI